MQSTRRTTRKASSGPSELPPVEPAEGSGDALGSNPVSLALGAAEAVDVGVAAGLPVTAAVGVSGAGDGVGPTGVTAVDAADGALVPPALLATTVNV
jgi:hypothetical protein